MAGPVLPGTLSPITLEGGGTIGGSLTFNAAGTVTDWNIVETGGSSGGFNFQGFTFTTANSQLIFFPDLVYGAFTLSSFDVRSNDYNSNTPGAHDLAITFDQIPATIPAGGVALTICTDLGRVCGDPASGINIPSGEEVRNPTQGDPFGAAIRQVTGGYFTISDPPGSISLNFTETPVLIPVNGGSDGGGTAVPEPATLSLFALGAALAVGSKRNRRKSQPEV
jgi:hypothetical protein